MVRVSLDKLRRAGILGKLLAANQVELVNLIVKRLTDHGDINVALLYSHRSPTSRRAARRRCAVQYGRSRCVVHRAGCHTG